MPFTTLYAGLLSVTSSRSYEEMSVSEKANNLYLGIDIGGTKCSVILGDGEGRILEKRRFPTRTSLGPQQTIDKVFGQNAKLAAVTRRDPTIVSRIWPVAEAFMGIVLLDQFIINLSYQEMSRRYS